MSQEKVDRYKKEKANRKKIMKKEKMENALRKCVVGVVALLLVGWIGYSAHAVYVSNRTVPEIQVDYQAFDDFSQNITEAAAAADAAAGEEAPAE